MILFPRQLLFGQENPAHHLKTSQESLNFHRLKKEDLNFVKLLQENYCNHLKHYYEFELFFHRHIQYQKISQYKRLIN